MAKQLLSEAKEQLGTLLNGKDGRLKTKLSLEDLEKRSFDFPTLVAIIQEAEAMTLITPMAMERVNYEGRTLMLKNFLELKAFVYEVEDRLDMLRIEALISQERGKDLFARVGSMTLHLQGSEPDDQDNNTHLMARGYNKVRKFLFRCHRKFRLNFTDLEPNFSWINEIRSPRNLTATENPKSPGVPKVVGRDEDKISIVNLLESDDDQQCQQGLPVISIVGPGGIGKSTLAELVIGDDKVMELFQIKMWVVVSAHEDLRGIARGLLKSANLCGDDPVQLLRDTVGKKRSLLVLDDARFLDIEKIEQLKASLKYTGIRGSRILVTTRNEKVARQLGTSLPYFLQPLNMDACWLLCQTIACARSCGNQSFKKQIQNNTPFMEHLKSHIFKRSGGLPLFVKAWCEILHSEYPKGRWKSIMECELREADSNVWDDLCHRLESSYSSLPRHLKLCFKYFSLIPKGYWIEKEVLTQLWMAEGFTNPEEEENAEKCFEELLFQTSFFKDIEKDEDGSIVRCKIHEPLYDIICRISEGEFCFITDGRFNELPLKPYSLHSSLCCFNEMPTENDLHEAKKMRTLLCFRSPSNFKVSDLSHLISHFKLLRVLDLSSSIIEELPNSVAKLEHLRYLNLSNTQIKKLPAFICNLYLLQALKLSHSLLSELPRGMWKLQNLRHLEIDGTPMNHLPPGIRRLNNIRKLSEFIVGGDGGCSIGELANLRDLQGRLIISHLDRVVDQGEAERADLNTKGCIKHLILDGKKHLNSQNLWHKRRFNSLLLEHMCSEAEFKLDDDRKMKSEKVFEGINPHPGLKKLEIWNYFGSKLPKWLESGSLSELVSLKVAKCLKMEQMPLLGGLPSLKFLHICDIVEVKSIGNYDLKGFPKLEQLTLEEMPKWEEWNLELQEGDLPCFLGLILSKCPKLKNLPVLPWTFRKLEIHDCKGIEWNPFPPLPTLEYLVLKGIGNMCSLPDAPNLVSLTIALSPEMTSFPNGFDKLKSLSALNIYFCPRLSLLPKELSNLQRIHIAGCRLLTDWLKKNKEILKKIPYIEVDNKVPTKSNLREKFIASPSKGEEEEAEVRVEKVNLEPNASKLRSLFNVDVNCFECDEEEFKKLKELVTLQLGRWSTTPEHHIELVNPIFLDHLKRLKKLRYLGLQGISRITELAGIQQLSELRVLDLRACHNLEKLPAEIASLKKLSICQRVSEIFQNFNC
ncbi:putative disease resistance RPP13-like protein 1 [Telopea speciosissima]|uniref:putative disease resistance RPP13-like protein 1 n=1 Tax=Telopea speciosissima TaxID=54955 RepID=UPI001CC7AC24|nr:putative disease resistance RPP13-like protein 1 [Telopea speciosissima]